jgi:hypothetical protein
VSDIHSIFRLLCFSLPFSNMFIENVKLFPELIVWLFLTLLRSM